MANSVPNERNTDHRFLELGSETFEERTQMGGMSLSARANLFLYVGFGAILAFAAMYVYVDFKVGDALAAWRSSQSAAALVVRVETGVARIKSQEKQFLLDKDPNAAEAFETDIVAVSRALDELYRRPDFEEVRQVVATLRDGLVQYDEQFVDVVKTERALGIADDSGISRRLQDTAKVLQTKLSQAGYSNLAGQVSRINEQGKETLLSGSRRGLEEVRQRYETLVAFLDAAEIELREKTEIMGYLKAHETDMLTLINRRFALESETERFNDIVAYVAPSLERLTSFSRDATLAATRRLDKAQTFARYTLGGGSASILLWVIFVGLLVIRSMMGGIRSVAMAAARLASGDRSGDVPGRGNVDSTGQLACALVRWNDDLAEMERIRQELDQTQVRLERSLEDADRQAYAAVEAAKAAFMSEATAEETPPEPEPQPQPEPEPLPEPQMPAPVSAREARGVPTPLEPHSGVGPISTVSQQLASFSEYVTAAAGDVERTEALIRGLQETNGQVEMLGNLVTSIRDQTNLLAFHTTGRDGRAPEPENLIPINEESRRSVEPVFPNRGAMQRFDAIREATERAERAVHAVRLSMDNGSAMAQEIASTASNQALEATNKLLSQSEYLQSMLDDIVAKISPAPPGRLSAPDAEKEERPPGQTGNRPPRRF